MQELMDFNPTYYFMMFLHVFFPVEHETNEAITSICERLLHAC